MKIKIYVLTAMVALAIAIPASAEMSDYEKGVANGMKIGFFMGELHGKGQYSTESAQQFNGFLDQFYQFLSDSFKNNQTMIDEFMKPPLPVKATATVSSATYPDSSGRILGYPADAYYTAVGAGPGGVPENPGNAMGWV